MTTVVTFLQDETGSMELVEDTAINSFNEYVANLQADDVSDYRFTLVLFNSSKTEVRHKGVPVTDVEPLNNDTYRPDDMTPLIDAFYKAILATEKVVEDGDKVVVVVQTDGQENCSTEYTNKELAQLVKDKRALGWEFVFIGVGIDAYDQAQQYGVSRGSTVSASASTYPQAMAAMGGNTRAYAGGQSMGMGFSVGQKAVIEDEDKPLPKQKKIKKKAVKKQPSVVDDMDFTG
jgi:hypothetical protein